MTRDEHIEKGRASCIPECCIMWWVDHLHEDFSDEQAWAPCNYVPCPACTEARRFVPIHLCDDACIMSGSHCPECGYGPGAQREFVRQPAPSSPERNALKSGAYRAFLASAYDAPTPPLTAEEKK